MWDLLLKGGWLMVPIVFCSILAVAIIIERLFFYSRLKGNPQKVTMQIIDLVRRNRIKEAIEVCEKKTTPVNSVLKAGLFNYDQPKDIVKEAIENVSLYEIPRLEKNINILGTLAHISPLLGLLGTVVGLVKCFYVIEQKSATVGVVNPADLAGGIWEALLTTVAGLTVAIIAYIAYNYFVSVTNNLVLSSERAATELIEALEERRSSEI